MDYYYREPPPSLAPESPSRIASWSSSSSASLCEPLEEPSSPSNVSAKIAVSKSSSSSSSAAFLCISWLRRFARSSSISLVKFLRSSSSSSSSVGYSIVLTFIGVPNRFLLIGLAGCLRYRCGKDFVVVNPLRVRLPPSCS